METISLSRSIVPILQGYEDAGDFTVTERLKTSLRHNLFFAMCVGSVSLCGLVLLITLHKNWYAIYLSPYINKLCTLPYGTKE